MRCIYTISILILVAISLANAQERSFFGVPIERQQEIIRPLTCNGCSFNNECIPIGTQKLVANGLIYCSSSKDIGPVKPNNEACSFNYECESFFCDQVCKKLEQTTSIEINQQESNTIIVAIIAISLIAISLYILTKKRIIIISSKKRKKQQQPKQAIFIPPRTRNLQSKRLDKKIEASVEEIGKILRRK